MSPSWPSTSSYLSRAGRTFSRSCVNRVQYAIQMEYWYWKIVLVSSNTLWETNTQNYRLKDERRRGSRFKEGLEHGRSRENGRGWGWTREWYLNQCLARRWSMPLYSSYDVKMHRETHFMYTCDPIYKGTMKLLCLRTISQKSHVDANSSSPSTLYVHFCDSSMLPVVELQRAWELSPYPRKLYLGKPLSITITTRIKNSTRVSVPVLWVTNQDIWLSQRTSSIMTIV